MRPAGIAKATRYICIALFLPCLLTGRAAAETLQQAWKTALEVDRGLKAARENTAAAVSLHDAARSARLPGLSLEGGYTYLDTTPALKAGLLGRDLQIPMAQQDFSAVRAVATLPIYTGGRISNTIDATGAAVQASKYVEVVNQQDLKLRVADAYVGVLRVTRLLKVAEAHVKSLEAHCRDVENLHEQGMVAKNDLLAVLVVLADARQRALQAANGLDLARAAYNRLLGRALNQDVVLEDLSPESEEPAVSTMLTQRALSVRSELAALDRQVAAVRSQASAVRGENMPQVALVGGYGYQENRYQVNPEQWSVILGVRWNLFDGGVVRHKAVSVDRQAASLERQRDEAASLIGLQVHQAVLDVQEIHKRMDVTRSAVSQAEENLRVTRDRYAAGLTTHTEVLEAETMRVNSESNHANAQFDTVMAGLRLKRATGEL